MNRTLALDQLRSGETFDVVVIGGGATGLGVAVDAAARGYRTALLEQHDFAKGTSSRSTKLVHGGVRYLRSGEIGLVRSALHERGLLERNAPHLVRRQAFVIPSYNLFGTTFYGIGLKLYEQLSGSLSFGISKTISASETRRLLPTVVEKGLRGGVVYYDGQFDDARLALALAETATQQGAAVVNYTRVEALLKEGGKISGVVATDVETGTTFDLKARTVINATGIFTDEIRHFDDPKVPAMLSVSSGVHLVLDKSYLPGNHALMIPKTSDGRVLFAVPWHNHVVVGTTDENRQRPELEPRPLEREIQFLFDQVRQYLDKPLTRADVLSVFVGLRPLVKKKATTRTSNLSRDHTIETTPSGLITITGGKWTSYRKMAQDTVDHASLVGGLRPTPSQTETLRIHGAPTEDAKKNNAFSVYGTDLAAMNNLVALEPSFNERLHPSLPNREVEVIWGARFEMARTVEDVLARRTRALLLNARAAIEAAPIVAKLLSRELIRSEAWERSQINEFKALAEGYLLEG